MTKNKLLQKNHAMNNKTLSAHSLSTDKLTAHFATDIKQGLSDDEVAHKIEEFGPNQITQQAAQSPFALFFLQFHQPLIYILLAAGIITLFLKEWIDASVIMAVVLANAIVGFLQESKALQAIAALSKGMSSTATVLRNGERRQVDAADLVPGDIVFLQSGDKVPADLRLVKVRELQVDESALTGESVPVQKSVDTLDQKTVLADRNNMAYASTLATYGVGTGIVVATGDKTEIGRINEMITAAEVLATPLTRRLTQFSHLLLYVILALSALTFVVGMLRGGHWLDMFMAVVALAVGAIPEGLPAAVTITLAIGVAKMAKRNVIIRKLPAVETLGSTTVICSDKTGTLTQNQMTVQRIYAGKTAYAVSGIGYEPEGSIENNSGKEATLDNQALQQCLIAGYLCNDAKLVADEENGWRVEGDPTEAALLVSASKTELELDELKKALPRIDTLPFESEHQYMATLHKVGGDAVVYLKGSIEKILERCEQLLNSAGEEVPLDVEACHGEAENMAEQGLRVLAFARKNIQADTELAHDQVASDLIFLGLQGMIDPPREEVVESVRTCQQAGIQVKMITGDHAVTAAAIAQEIGLQNENSRRSERQRLKALTGAELSELDNEELVEVAVSTAVFARVAPEQKLRLVEALQSKGHVVAMTGDGVNDAPALKQADIGVAMGITGTEVAKEAADMLLTDDNFSSIEAAVEEGRGVYDNLLKFITWTLPTNVGEGLIIVTAIFLGMKLPILPVQILWINLTTAILLGLMLAFEPKEPGLMERQPRDTNAPLLGPALIVRICLVGVLLLIGAFVIFQWELMRGSSIEMARTMVVNVFAVWELFYLFNCRSLVHPFWRVGVFSNPLLLVAVVGMILAQLLFTYAPFMQHAFGSAPIGLREWLLLICGGICLFFIIELEKALRRMVSDI